MHGGIVANFAPKFYIKLMLLILLPLAIIFLILLPSIKTRVLSVFYFLSLFVFLWGIEGFILSSKPSDNEVFAFQALFIVIIAIHIPLLLRLVRIDHKNSKLRIAREIFGSDILHLNEEQLKRHLEN